MKIGNITVSNNIFLAPLAGVTDVAFRMLCKEYGAGLTYTEMVSGKGLLYNNKKTEDLLITDNSESPCAVQLFGAEPEVIAAAVKNPLLNKFDIIDINMGCPVEKVVKCGEGSALLKNIPLAAKIIRAAVKNSGRPVTVKFRTGYDENNIVTAEFARMCESEGAALITVHGRTRRQMYSGKADYYEIARAKQSVKIPVIANGDIFTRGDMDRALNETGADGVMIGRGALGRPFIFASMLGNSGAVNIADVIIRHIDRLRLSFEDRFVTVNMRKHIAWYLKGVSGGKPVKEAVNLADNTGQIKEVISGLAEVNMRY